ncbi:MAG: response regulator [Acidobacteria bacterium]|nr:response regulator [Acidobacteriota bacterium]
MGINVLIVDDSSVMRKIVERSLRQASKETIDEVIEAGDGGEAIEKLAQKSVQVVFSDINMPNVSGLDFLRRLKETKQASTPVIMVTTEGGEKTVLEAISLGAKGFIKKPFTAAQMEAALAKALPG